MSTLTLRLAKLCRHSLRIPIRSHKVIRSLSSSARPEEQLLGPDIPGSSPKVYPEKIENIAEQIANLTLLEIADLCELLQHKLNIQTPGPMMAAMQMPTSSSEASSSADQQPTPVKSSFSVKLVKFDPAQKVPLIKEIKATMPDMNLVQAKKFVESAPGTVKTDVAKDEAEALKKALEAVGAVVEID